MDTDVCKVLLVQDNQRDAFADLFSRRFQRELREVAATSCGMPLQLTHEASVVEALARLRYQEFDLVLLDLTLSDNSAFPAFTTLRNAARHMPVVVLTEAGNEQLAMKAVREGAQDYLIKGRLTSDRVFSAIHHALEHNRAEGALRESRERCKRIQALYDEVLHSVPSSIGMLTPDWRLSFANPAMVRLLCPRSKCHSSHLVGRELATFFSTPEEFMQFRRTALEFLQGRGPSYQEVKLLRLDGTTVTCEVGIVHLKPSESEAGLVLTVVDLTGRNRSRSERESFVAAGGSDFRNQRGGATGLVCSRSCATAMEPDRILSRR